jgi:probable F420-dependent oxidoreductase
MADVKPGLVTFATAGGTAPAALARAAEKHGFTSLWFAEHSHIPLPRRTPWPGGDDLPRWYYEAMDPIVAMTAAATATTSLRVGTGIALLVQRDPIQFAKEIASLDVLSGGRVSVGVGAGWNLEELADHGTDPGSRWKLLRERVEAVRKIWTSDPAEYHGDLVDFGPMVSLPKPVQRPHPPIVVGGGYPHGMRRAIAYGDAWMPILGRGGPDPLVLVRELAAGTARAGRDPGSIEFVAYAPPEHKETLRALIGAGVTQLLFFVRPEDPEGMDARLHAIADLVKNRL